MALEKWIVFGLRLSRTFLSHEDAKELWSLALNSGGTTVLHRDGAKMLDKGLANGDSECLL